jgi:transcriptional regulator with XRE-family HTH domain
MHQLASIPATQTFGTLLKHWRLARRMSQLALALEAEISARHLSFLETGRALPSRDMVLLLATMLDTPLRERNALLIAAGYAPVYQEWTWPHDRGHMWEEISPHPSYRF